MLANLDAGVGASFLRGEECLSFEKPVNDRVDQRRRVTYTLHAAPGDHTQPRTYERSIKL